MKRANLVLLLLLLSAVVFTGFLLAGERHFYIWEPNLHHVLMPQERFLPGVRGKALFTTNSIGLRGDPLQGQEVKILAIGGSTTECFYLDDKEAWPHLLQEELERALHKSVWVGNAGRSGRNSRHHVLQVEKLLSEIPGVDLVVILMGANDLGHWLGYRDYNPEGLSNLAIRARMLESSFSVHPTDGFRRRLSLKWRLLKQRLRGGDRNHPTEAELRTGSWYEKERLKRKTGPHLPVSPEKLATLPAALGEYRGNIGEIIRLCQQHRVKVLFLTQPSLHRASPLPAEEALFWFGGMDISPTSGEPSAYVTSGQMRELLDEYNRILLGTARLRGIAVFDLDAEVSPVRDAFYDDAHFNEKGSALVAKLVAQRVADQELHRE